MRHKQFFPPALAGILALALIGCTETGVGSFQREYTVARNALEAGKFDKASRLYAGMLSSAGALEPRIRLEYAHSLLRAGSYKEAAAQAQAVSQTQSGTARSAALAVYGTAQHELAMQALDAGAFAEGKQYLARAQSAFGEVLKEDPGLDPLGAITGRKKAVDVQLKRLG